MQVIVLTVFLSLVLMGLFVILYIDERAHRRFGSSERDALLPLEDEVTRPAQKAPRQPR